MPERIITDGHGDRWDVRQDDDGRLVYRHQSGRSVTLEADGPLDSLENRTLLRMLAESGRAEGIGEEQGGARSEDPEGYVTRSDEPGPRR